MCDDVDKVYIGSTTSFRHRKSAHKNACCNDKDRYYNKDKYKYIRENGGWNNWKMIEIEKYPCNDYNEAFAREQYYIDYYKDKTTNINRAFVDRNSDEYKEEITLYKKEHYNKNREAILLYHKEYQQENKEEIALYKKKHSDKNREAISLYQKEYREKNRDKIFLQRKQYRDKKKAERLSNTGENKNINININDEITEKKDN